jgi:preprotein translocase subunit SecE
LNREMRRHQAKEEERAKKKRSEASRSNKKSNKDKELGFFARTTKYFREVRQEMKKVAWPSREELITYSVVVFGITTVMTVIVFGLDWAFSKLVADVLRAIT